MAKEISENRARQGRWGSPVLIVLLVSLALVCAVWVGVEMYGSAIETPQTQTGPNGAPAQPADNN